MKAFLAMAMATAVALACLCGAAAPAAAECNDRWQKAQKLTAQAQALYDQKKYPEASQAFEAASLAWMRAAGDCVRAEANTARANSEASEKNAKLMLCLQNYDAAQAVTDKARKLAAQEKWLEAEKVYDQAHKAWLDTAAGCDPDNADRAKRNAKDAAKNAKTVSDNYLEEKSR